MSSSKGVSSRNFRSTKTKEVSEVNSPQVTPTTSEALPPLPPAQLQRHIEDGMLDLLEEQYRLASIHTHPYKGF